MAITWDEFKYKNSNTRTAFENMCRMLFRRYYFDCYVSLHSNPNNPGVEVVPIYSEKLAKTISFQAKHFDSSVDYDQIKKSAKKAVEYYSEELDLVVLYSNKDISTTAKPFVEIKKLLQEANIELELVTNQEILDQVIQQPIIKDTYFGNYSIDESWVKDHVIKTIDSLGDRHNHFNVETNTNNYLSIFIHDNEGTSLINQKKNEQLKG